jgi:hypothetical protein
MTREEQAAFEELLGAEPDLAAAVRTARRVGEALREQPAALSPDFYARARRRFEESTGKRRAGFRMLSWETAGLAAAAVLAVALFVPHFMHQGTPVDSPDDGLGAGEATDSDTVTLDEESAEGKFGIDAPRPQREKKGDAAPTPAESGDDRGAEKKQESRTGAEEEFAPVPPAAQRDAIAVAPAAEPELRMEQSTARAPATVQGRATMKGAPAPLRSGAKSEAADVAAAVPLPLDVVDSGTIQTLERKEAWDALLRSEAGGDLSALGPPDPARRLVLIGDRGDLGSCADLSVVATADGWEIRYRPVDRAGRERAASGGCALSVPRDGRPVRLVPSP